MCSQLLNWNLGRHSGSENYPQLSSPGSVHEADLPLGNLGWKGYLETTQSQSLVKAGLIKSGGSGRFLEHFYKILKFYHLCGQPVLISDHPGDPVLG